VTNAATPFARAGEQKKSWLILALLWGALLVLSVLRPLAVPDEGRYGDVGRWMLLTGDWLTPRLNGLPFFHKPPFLYWLQAMSMGVFGVNAFALRLIPALHVGLMLVVLYLSARAITNEQTARRAAIMLGTSLGFLVGGQYVNHDMMVAAWIGVAIWCFAFAFLAGDKPHAWLARLGFLACALGLLSKGLIGIALPGLVLLIWLIWTRQLRKILYLPWLTGLALFSVISVPWFVLGQQKYPELLNYFFIHHHFARYTAKNFNNPQPIWFYLLAIGLLLFPWAMFALAQVRLRWRSALSSTGLDRTGDVARHGISLCWIWVVSITVFFSLPSSKLVGYIVPVVPPVALLAALGWERLLSRRSWAPRLFAGLCVLNLGLALAIVLKVGGITAPGRSQDVAEVLACAARPTDTVYVFGGFPYDLPFYSRAAKPMVVLADWAERRANAGDGWERELFEAADFDPAQATMVLKSPEAAVAAGQVRGNWLVMPMSASLVNGDANWKLFFKGVGWQLYQSGAALGAGSAPEGPEAAEQKGLPGCKH
jgi:4-amino-4-deoxy-L-arabinose transferase-like glycosyltransferase